MWSRVSVLTPPAAPETALLSLDDLRGQLNLSHTESDPELVRFLAAAVGTIDGPQGIGYALLSQTWRLTLDAFPASIRLPGAPIKSVTAITYLDADGVETVLPSGDYRVALAGTGATVSPAFGKSWPAPRAVEGAITVDYVLGEASGATVDGRLINAVLRMVDDMNMHRGGVITGVSVSSVPKGIPETLDAFRQNWATS